MIVEMSGRPTLPPVTEINLTASPRGGTDRPSGSEAPAAAASRWDGFGFAEVRQRAALVLAAPRKLLVDHGGRAAWADVLRRSANGRASAGIAEGFSGAANPTGGARVTSPASKSETPGDASRAPMP